jgi:hypothetical protein
LVFPVFMRAAAWGISSVNMIGRYFDGLTRLNTA